MKKHTLCAKIEGVNQSELFNQYLFMQTNNSFWVYDIDSGQKVFELEKYFKTIKRNGRNILLENPNYKGLDIFDCEDLRIVNTIVGEYYLSHSFSSNKGVYISKYQGPYNQPSYYFVDKNSINLVPIPKLATTHDIIFVNSERVLENNGKFWIRNIEEVEDRTPVNKSVSNLLKTEDRHYFRFHKIAADTDILCLSIIDPMYIIGLAINTNEVVWSLYNHYVLCEDIGSKSLYTIDQSDSRIKVYDWISGKLKASYNTNYGHSVISGVYNNNLLYLCTRFNVIYVFNLLLERTEDQIVFGKETNNRSAIAVAGNFLAIHSFVEPRETLFLYQLTEEV